MVAIRGPEATGKTFLGLSGPKPLAYQGIDLGHEGVIDQWLEDYPDQIVAAIYDKPMTAARGGESADKFSTRIQKEFTKLWDEWERDFAKSLGVVKTVVWDTGTEIHEALRWSLHGKVEKVRARLHGEVSRTYASLVAQAIVQDYTNLVILHKETDVWVNDKATGGTRLKGYKDTGYLCQVILKSSKKMSKRHGSTFFFEVEKCRFNRELEGHVFEDPTFYEIACLVMEKQIEAGLVSEDDFLDEEE